MADTELLLTYQDAEAAYFGGVEDWDTLTCRLPRNELPNILGMVAESLDAVTMRRAVIEAWCMAEFPESYIEQSQWITWWRDIGYTEAGENAQPPDQVVLYRGGIDPNRMAWTGSPETAEWFRDRFTGGRLWTATVPADRLLAHITHVRDEGSGRGEDEYVIDPVGLVAQEVVDGGPTTERGAGLRAGLPTDLVPWRIAVQCRCCRRWLTDPASVQAGIGPLCASREAG